MWDALIHFSWIFLLIETSDYVTYEAEYPPCTDEVWASKWVLVLHRRLAQDFWELPAMITFISGSHAITPKGDKQLIRNESILVFSIRRKFIEVASSRIAVYLQSVQSAEKHDTTRPFT